MTKARQLADLLDASGDVSTAALDNVPPNTALVDSSDNTVLDTSSGSTSITNGITVSSTGSSEGQSVFQSDGDISVRLRSSGASGEVYHEYINGLTTDANSWKVGLNDDKVMHFAYGSLGSMNYQDKLTLNDQGDLVVAGDLTVSGDIIGGGKVLQVVQGYTSAKAYITSSGYVWQDAATITPTSTSSKILVMFNLAFGRINLNGGLKLVRNDGYFMPNLGGAYLGGATAAQGAFNTADDGLTPQHDYSIGMYPVSYLDSPASTSPQSYGVYVYFGNSGYVPFNRQYNDNGGYACSTVTLMEIAG